MRVVPGEAERGPVISSAIVFAALATLGLTVVGDFRVDHIAPLAGMVALAAVAYRTLLQWHALLALLLLVILFIPIKRYSVPADLPFDFEPYRLMVAVVALGWLSSLLIDPRVRLRRSGFEGPLLLFALAALGSIIVNGGRVAELGESAEPLKDLTFLASFFLVFYLIVSVVRKRETLDFLLRLLVVGGVVIAVLAVVESRTRANPFNNLESVIPLLQLDQSSVLTEAGARPGRLRTYGPAQHPIALGAFLVMLIPLALYLAKMRSRAVWLSAAALLLVGALATVSRTTVPMLLAIGLVFLWLRPRETKRFWPALLPALIAVHFLVPGTLGTLKASFFPSEGLVQEQREGGRVEDIGPSLAKFSERPLLGEGYGTRVVTGEQQNADVLDNEWLGILLETGAVGFLAWVWLFWRFVRRLGRFAKRDYSAEGWLLAALAASVAAYAVGMLFYDAFSFIQVTFLLYILLGFGAALLSRRASPASSAAGAT